MAEALILESNVIDAPATGETDAVALQSLYELTALELGLVGGGQASISLI